MCNCWIWQHTRWPHLHTTYNYQIDSPFVSIQWLRRNTEKFVTKKLLYAFWSTDHYIKIMIATTISQFFSYRCLSCHRSVLACGKSSFRGVHWNNKTGEINFLCIAWDSRFTQFTLLTFVFPSLQVRDRSNQTILVNINLFLKKTVLLILENRVWRRPRTNFQSTEKVLRWENYHIDSGRNVFVILRWYWLNFKAPKTGIIKVSRSPHRKSLEHADYSCFISNYQYLPQRSHFDENLL